MRLTKGWLRALVLPLVLALLVAAYSGPAAAQPDAAIDGPGASAPAGTQAPAGGEAGAQDSGAGQGSTADEDEPWWKNFDPREWVKDIVDGVKQAITERAVDATTVFVRAAFTPANAEMLTMAGLAADRIPPGRVSAIRRTWSGIWWASVALLLVVAMVQAIRVMVDRVPDERGRVRWVEWLLYPVLGVLLARASLFVVDTLVLLQNELWRDALAEAAPCALFYGYCPDNGSLVEAAIGMTVGLVVWVLTILPTLLLSFLLALNWVFLALVAIVGPIYIVLSAGGRTLEPMAGWLAVVIRSALVQTWVGVGLFILMLFREAGQEPGVVGAFIRGLNAAGLTRFGVVLMLDLAIIYWWLIPAFRAASDLVTLRGGQVLMATGQVAGTIGALLAGAGVVTGNPALVAAGSRTAMIGRSASVLGAEWHERARAAREAREHGGGGWITQPGFSLGSLHRSELATRTVVGLSPVAPYRVTAGGVGELPGTVQVTAAPGLAGAAASAMLARGLEVRVKTRDFEAPAHEAERVWKAFGRIVVEDGGYVQVEQGTARTAGLSADQLAAVAKALDAAGVKYQKTESGIVVDREDAPALRRAVVRAMTGIQVVGDRVRFTLPSEHAASTLAALHRAGVHVAAHGPFEATAWLKGQREGDTSAARKVARRALAQAERDALVHRPGYYRYGDRYIIVRLGEPIRMADAPPEKGVYLGEWPKGATGATGPQEPQSPESSDTTEGEKE